jgi:PAS domain S-box-containing protein
VGSRVRKAGARATPEKLRASAEETLAGAAAQGAGAEAGSAQELLHELQVHQIELEMQNEQLRQVQVDLEAARDAYVDLYDFSPLGYFSLTEKALIAQVNLTGAAMWGAPRPRLLRRRFRGFIAPDDYERWDAHFLSILRGQEKARVELRLLRADGSAFWGRLDSIRRDGPDGAPMVRLSVTDITERKRAEEERLELERRLLHAQRLESLGVLAGGIAHDFNNLLMAILGNLELALMTLSPVSPARDEITRAIQASKRAADLTRQMLAYSGKGRYVVRKLDINELVEENAHIFRTAISRNVTLNLHLEPQLPFIEADAGQIQQVVMNLITNASEAVGEQAGMVSLRTGVGQYQAADLSASCVEEKPAAGRFVWLEVTDTGCGMDAETQARIFDPFFTTKFTGRGLGMSAVQGIVRGHNGAIFVDSAVNKGTTVRVLFPALAPSVAAGPAETAADAPPEPALSGLVLIVDDDEMVRDLAERMVRKMGLETLKAADGIEAATLYRQHASEIVVVILDLTMPRMDGVATYVALRQVKRDVKVILCSGFSQTEAMRHFGGQGLAGFIQKPYDLDALRAEVRRVVRGAA